MLFRWLASRDRFVLIALIRAKSESRHAGGWNDEPPPITPRAPARAGNARSATYS
jgi:hypothetical protein